MFDLKAGIKVMDAEDGRGGNWKFKNLQYSKCANNLGITI